MRIICIKTFIIIYLSKNTIVYEFKTNTLNVKILIKKFIFSRNLVS